MLFTLIHKSVSRTHTLSVAIPKKSSTFLQILMHHKPEPPAEFYDPFTTTLNPFSNVPSLNVVVMNIRISRPSFDIRSSTVGHIDDVKQPVNEISCFFSKKQIGIDSFLITTIPMHIAYIFTISTLIFVSRIACAKTLNIYKHIEHQIVKCIIQVRFRVRHFIFVLDFLQSMPITYRSCVHICK